MDVLSGTWEKVDREYCYLYLEVDGKIKQLSLRFDIDHDVDHIRCMVKDFVKTDKFDLVFNEEVVDDRTNISNVYGKRVTIRYRNYNKWFKRGNSYLFSITTTSNRYTFHKDGDTCIGSILVDIIRNNPTYYLLFYSDGIVIVNFDLPIKEFYNREITCKEICLPIIDK